MKLVFNLDRGERGGEVDDFSISVVEVHFMFCRLNFVGFFSYLTKCFHIMNIVILFSFGIDCQAGLHFYARFTSLHTHTSLLNSFVCFLSFILAVPMRECLGKHSCMSSSFL